MENVLENQEETLEVAEVAETTESTQETELKGSKLTDAFKVAIQKTFAEKGIKLSKQAAWELYKEITNTVVAFTVQHKKVSLAGVGVFRIHESKPEGTKIGVFNMVPRFKYSPSDRIINNVFKSIDCFVSEEAKEAYFTAPTPTVSESTENVVSSHEEVAVTPEPTLENNVPDFDLD